MTDGRALPVDPLPTWNGYSVGKWDGDTLVVQSNGFRDDMWLDANSSPMTSAATITERFRRPKFGALEVDVTVDDPKAYRGHGRCCSSSSTCRTQTCSIRSAWRTRRTPFICARRNNYRETPA
jgi:hypothetical protein